MSKECADCGNERIMLCPFCEHDFSESSKDKDAELTQLREAVRVLEQNAETVRQQVRDITRKVAPSIGETHTLDYLTVLSARIDPIARAAVEGGNRE